MRIISERKGFQADHSSTSYEFLAVDRKLKPEEKKAVAKLSSRARPTGTKVSFVYNGDWSDLPGGWKPLMEKYYDVMYSESYDWWTLAMAFDTDEKTIEILRKYAFSGCDDLGVSIEDDGIRVVVSISCRIEPDRRYFRYKNDYDYEGDEDEDAPSYDPFLKLLTKNREYLKKGDYRLLYGVWEQYGESEEDFDAPELPMDKLPKPIKDLLDMLGEI